MIPAVVAPTRTFPETAGPQTETGRRGRPAPARPRFGRSQSVDQLHGHAEDGEHRLRQQDENQRLHVDSSAIRFATAHIGPLRARTIKTLSAVACPTAPVGAFLTAAGSP